MSSQLQSFWSSVVPQLRAIHAGIMFDAPPSLSNNDDPNSPAVYIGTPQPLLPPLPGPWGFVTSGYGVGLLAVAIIMNRIQNIVVPPRHLFTYRLPRTTTNRHSFLRSIYYSILPLDFSSTTPRLISRVISIYLMCRALFLWTVILLQISNLYPAWGWITDSLGNWVTKHETADVCWSTFVAVCFALCIGALTRGLEGASPPSNAAPFNMFGYSFLLQIYSTPMTHVTRGRTLPARPDKHVVVTIVLPLLQLTILHVLGVKKKWSNYRLVPTALSCVLGLIHFHTVLWFSPSSYPLLNYMPCLFESLLASVILLTITLNGLTQILLEGAITRPLLCHSSMFSPKWEDDFAIVLLRLGTASLEATSVAGLGNEVGGVAVSAAAEPSMSQTYTEYGKIEVSRYGVSSISAAVEVTGKRRRAKAGFANEIQHIKAVSGEAEAWFDTSWYRELMTLGVACINCARGLWRLFLRALPWRRKRNREGRGGGAAAGRPDHTQPQTGASSASTTRSSEGGEASDADAYHRFLHGLDISDEEEDDDFQLPSGSRRTSLSSATSDDTLPPPVSTGLNDDVDNRDNCGRSEEGEGDEVDEDQDGAPGSYADMSSVASGASTSAPVILTHITGTEGVPLTRGRYRRLIEGSERGGGAQQTLKERRGPGIDNGNVLRPPEDNIVVGGGAQIVSGSGRDSPLLVRSQQEEETVVDSRRNCVVCTAEPRQVICWPCRCLALCDDCRGNLASRSAASKHRCPCCRRHVEGYSRIFIP